MKKNIFIYLVMSFFCLLTTPLAAQDDCGDTFDKIKELHSKKKCKAAKVECESYLRHCGSNAQVEQILRECEECLKPTPPVSPSKPFKPTPQQKRFCVNTKHVEFQSDGGLEQVSVTADGSWDIYDAPGWLSCMQEGNTLTIICGTNYYSSAREKDIILEDEYGQEVNITVIQDRNHDYLRLSANLIDDQGDGGVYSIKVNSNKAWRVRDYPYWCKIEILQGELKVSLDRNYTGYDRKGSIDLVSQQGEGNLRRVISVKQATLSNYLILSHSGFSDNTGKGSTSTAINVDTDLGVFHVLNVPTWCEIINKTTTSFAVRILRNSGGGEREAELKVVAGNKNQTFVVSQVARLRYVDVSPDVVLLATKRGGYQTYQVKTNTGYWRVVNLPDWCQLQEQTDDTFSINILPNEGSPRTATFSVSTSGERCNLTIKQD